MSMNISTEIKDLYGAWGDLDLEALNDLQERQRRGARILDARKPGWRDEINLDSLNMDDSRACILGQLYGRYGHGYAMLGLHPFDDDAPVSYGFAIPVEEEDVAERYAYLHHCWWFDILTWRSLPVA